MTVGVEHGDGIETLTLAIALPVVLGWVWQSDFRG